MDSKICSRCNIDKPITDYNRYKKFKNGEPYFAYYTYCKKCKVSVYSANQRASYLKKKFNLTVEEYQDLYIAQSGVCLICKVDFLTLPKRPAIDHCHNTGKIRGLLCANCNAGIGFLKDDPKILREAAKYLTKFL